MEILGVIPARYKSSRFPGKPLAKINGRELVLRVCDKVSQSLGKKFVVATDDERIRKVVEDEGFEVVMTSSEHLTGTDRVAEVAKHRSADIYVNIQGDEPLIYPDDIQKILAQKLKTPNYIINGMCNLSEIEDPSNINIPKVLVNKDNDLIYMSRLAIPGIKSGGIPSYKKQVCIYAFTKSELEAFSNYGKKASFEAFEDIEILRFLDLGFKIKMVEVNATQAVDEPNDIHLVENILNS